MKQVNEKQDLTFVRKIREAWGRPELSPGEAMEFDRALRERMNSGQGKRWAVVAAMAAAAAVVVYITVPWSGDAPRRAAQVQEVSYDDGENWYAQASYNDSYTSTWPDKYDPDAALSKMLNGEYKALVTLVAPSEL
jgi:hypothetical protein